MSGASKDLVQHILKTKNCDAAISKRLIHFIDPQSIPESLDQPEAFRSVVLAKGAISVVFTQCRFVISEGTGGKEMGQLLGAHHSALLLWFRFFVDRRPPTHALADAWFPCLSIAHFLHMMVVVDSDLENTIMASTLAVDTIITLWAKQSDRGRYISGGGKGGSCPMAGLLLSVINHDLGTDTLLTLSHTTPRAASKMTLTFRERVQEQADDRLQASYSIRRLTELVNLARALSRPSRFPCHLFIRLRSPAFLADLCETLHAILRRHTGPFPLDEVVNTLKLIGDVALSGDAGDSDPIKMVKAALDSGIYSVIVKAIGFSPPSSRPHFFLLSFLSETAAYAIYPSVSDSLIDALAGAHESETKDDESFRMCWDMISLWGTRRGASLKKDGRTRGIKCDYVQLSFHVVHLISELISREASLD